MAREWTERHIVEMIEQTGDGLDGKTAITESLRKSVGLEYRFSADYNSLTTRNKTTKQESNIGRVNISIPELTIFLPFRYAEMFAGQVSFEAPVELTIALNSPFQQLNEDGFIGYIAKPRPARFQVTGGWLDAIIGNEVRLDPSLIYPDIEIDITMFRNMTDEKGHLLHIREETMTVYPDYSGFYDVPVEIPVYRLSVDGLTEWPSNGFHFHKVLTLGV